MSGPERPQIGPVGGEMERKLGPLFHFLHIIAEREFPSDQTDCRRGTQVVHGETSRCGKNKDFTLVSSSVTRNQEVSPQERFEWPFKPYYFHVVSKDGW